MIIYCLCVEVVVLCVISFETCCVVQAATLQHLLFNNPAHYVLQFSITADQLPSLKFCVLIILVHIL